MESAPYRSRAGIQTPADTSAPKWSLFFTLILLVSIIAILLAAPGFSRIDRHQVSINHSNLRQIGQASLIYASGNQDRLPQTPGIYAFAFELARGGGLHDATIWMASTEDRAASRLSTVLNSHRTALHPSFAAVRPSIAAAVRGIHIKLPSTTPIAWTRGLQPDGTWSKDSPYDGAGGHIVFLGGYVVWFRKAELIDRDGRATTDIRAALPPDAVIANN